MIAGISKIQGAIAILKEMNYPQSILDSIKASDKEQNSDDEDEDEDIP